MESPPPIQILQETTDYLVVNKPAPLVVHHDTKYKEGTLVDELLEKYPEIASVGDEPSLRPGIVHRLDKGVSGVMVVARTQAAFEYLKKQFASRLVHKTYHALVHGAVSKDVGEITTTIGRTQSGFMTARTAPSREQKHADKSAITRYTVHERYPHYTYLEVHPLTGRMHQIRVHLNSIGHPIIGDPVYTSKRYTVHERNMQKRFPILTERLWLHAYHITFTDPAGLKQSFTSPVPDAMMDIIDSLNK